MRPKSPLFPLFGCAGFTGLAKGSAGGTELLRNERGSKRLASAKRIKIGSWLISGVLGLATTFGFAEASSSWIIVPSPNVAASIQSRLNGISCPSAKRCVAVGYYITSSNGSSGLIERLAHGRWTIVRSPYDAGAVLNGVSCATATTCIAVGTGSQSNALIEQLSGGSWTVVPSPPAPPSELEAVSCTSSTTCTAVGFSQAAPSATLIEQLSGGTWTVVPSPNAAGSSNNLSGVSCITASNCVAVGQSDDSSGDHTLVEQLSGGVWSIVPAPDITLNGVSCSSASSCIAVGNTGIEQFVGGAWQTMPNPNAGNLESVSCTNHTDCFVVGQTAPGTAATLVERLVSGVWTVVPSANVAGAPTSVLLGASCTGTTTCRAAGFSQASSGDVSTLIERD
jgi:hypothetical protein